MNQKGIAPIIMILTIVGVLVLGILGAGIYSWQKPKTILQKACTQEAKLCPDGSYVSRTGPNCEFATCPETKKEETRNCVSDNDCVIFGKAGDCNCGCFNKNYKWESGGNCYCAPSSSCKCVSGKCEGVFDETASWQIYRNEEYGFELKIPKELSNYSVKRDEKIDDPSWGIKGKSVQYYFTVPYNKNDQFLLFEIMVFTNEQWGKIYPVSERGRTIIPIMDGEVIAENSNFTFIKVSGCLDCSGQEEPLKYINPILSTFKFID